MGRRKFRATAPDARGFRTVSRQAGGQATDANGSADVIGDDKRGVRVVHGTNASTSFQPRLQPGSVRLPQWICNCGSYNYAERSVCRGCTTTAPAKWLAAQRDARKQHHTPQPEQTVARAQAAAAKIKKLEAECAELRANAGAGTTEPRSAARKLPKEELAEDDDLRKQHCDLVQAAEAADRDLRANPGNSHFQRASQHYREQAAHVLQRLRATWSPSRKQLLLERQVHDAEMAAQKAGTAREAADECLRQAREQAEAKHNEEREAENRLTELRVELEKAQKAAALATSKRDTDPVPVARGRLVDGLGDRHSEQQQANSAWGQLVAMLPAGDQEVAAAMPLLRSKANTNPVAAVEIQDSDNEEMFAFSDAEDDFFAEGVTREQFEKLRTRFAIRYAKPKKGMVRKDFVKPKTNTPQREMASLAEGEHM